MLSTHELPKTVKIPLGTHFNGNHFHDRRFILAPAGRGASTLYDPARTQNSATDVSETALLH